MSATPAIETACEQQGHYSQGDKGGDFCYILPKAFAAA
jgi:hypothetical protein